MIRPSPGGKWLSLEYIEGRVGLGQSWCFQEK